MEILLLSFLGVALTTALRAKQKHSPIPESALSFDFNKDPKTWVPQFEDSDINWSILELVPEGESIEAWREMVSQQITFAKVPLRAQVDFWQSGLLRADPKVEFNEEQKADGSIVVTYTSHAAKEFSIRRFIEAKDGVYMIAYHVRPELRDEARVQIWAEIIQSAKLVPNPDKK